MTKGNHDTLVYRLSQMLIKLNQGEKLIPSDLANEFGVTLRTIQRDLNVRFAYLPLKKRNGHYFLEQAYLGKLTFKDINNFANLAGVHGLFPSLSGQFLRDIFDQSLQSTLLVKGHHYESLTGKKDDFRLLEQSIYSNLCVSFDYTKNDKSKHYISVSPYKLINHKGIWYLVALDNTKIKTFSFTKIKNILQTNKKYKYDSKVDKYINEEDGIWFRKEQIEFVLKVSNEVAAYFKRRKLIANQVIEKELENGDLIISTKVGHFNQVLPIVQYWIPHLRIISPDKAKKEMCRSLNNYLDYWK